MKETIKKQISDIIEHMPSDWLKLTTHRLDIYNESRAKIEFLEKLEAANEYSQESLSHLPTAFDYIRLGHPLSCVLEWALSKEAGLPAESVISFSSQVMPVLAILRKNKFLNKKTQILYKAELPQNFNPEVLKSIYDYQFDVIQTDHFNEAAGFDGSTITINSNVKADFNLHLYANRGSVVEVLNNDIEYIKEIQHVRRRESIAMTPQNCLATLKEFIDENSKTEVDADKGKLVKTIHSITSSTSKVAIGSSGLSVQYAIMMGLIHHAQDHHSNKKVKFIVPPNCYGGTNDQARRVAACLDHVEIIDLPVDSGKDMVTELERILKEIESASAIPYIIAEIPTNPRVEIPDLQKLHELLKNSPTNPVFILDQTFCPNVKFFGENGYLKDARVISYVSGSKFPSGGLCTAGYAAANESADEYMEYVENHLALCDNDATKLQIEILNQEMPSMNDRIAKAYQHTRSFVDFIQEQLPNAKINFVSHELATAGFTPSVFSFDLGNLEQNHQLIKMMIEEIPEESKHCVSYGQLKGCYWTIPATSTQGTTKESDKDYIIRVSIGANFNLNKHQKVFNQYLSLASD